MYHFGLEKIELHTDIMRMMRSRRMRWAGACSTYGGQQRCMQVIGGGRHEVNRPFGRPRHRWEDNIKMDLEEVGIEEWTGSIWLRTGTAGRLLSTW